MESKDKDLLSYAWGKFADYDDAANSDRLTFSRLYGLYLILGILATLLPLTLTQFKESITSNDMINAFFNIAILLLPISITILTLAAKRFRPASRSTLFRRAAENLKKEIYLFRTRSGHYSEKKLGSMSRGQKLVSELEIVDKTLLDSLKEQKMYSSFKRHTRRMFDMIGIEDAWIKDITIDQYLNTRFEDSITYYKLKSNYLETALKRLQWIIYLMGGAGTFLAAIGFQLWIALTTTIGAALVAYLENKRIERTLTTYSEKILELENIKVKWMGLSDDEKKNPDTIEEIITSSEKLITSGVVIGSDPLDNNLQIESDSFNLFDKFGK